VSNKKLLIISNNNLGDSLSGGDQIFLNLAKHWQKKFTITIIGSQETKNLLNKHQLSKITFFQTDSYNSKNFPSFLNLLRHTIKRTLKSIFHFFKYRHLYQTDYIYSASDFYPDFFPAFLTKLFYPKTIWLASFYLFAPSPFSHTSPYFQKQKLKGLFYYLSQLPVIFSIKHFSDYVFVTSTPDISKFPHKKVIVVRGGVDIAPSQKYLKSKNTIPFKKRKYDAVFIGRLHLQKGVLELIDIWKLVTKKIPNAQLAIIGDGQLEIEIRQKIKKLKLSKNIHLLGFMSAPQNYKIFKDSKLVVHPATYDSGGMAAAEAMAWGLPGVSFDLPALKTYYPQGMLKTPPGNLQQFADNIVKLLTNDKFYQKISAQSIKLIKNIWDWNFRTSYIYNKILND